MESLAPPLTPESLRQALRRAGEAGLTKMALAKLGQKPRQSAEAKAAANWTLQELLASLEADRRIVNAGTARTPRYLLPEFDLRLDHACEALETKATPGQPTLFKAAALRKGLPKGIAKDMAEEAIRQLLGAGRLLELRAGKSIFYLHARAVAPLIAPDLLAGRPTPVREPEAIFSPETVRSAYAQLVREGGFADVLISELCQRSGGAVPEVGAWLLAESRAGRAAPSRGDWSLASPAARAAG